MTTSSPSNNWTGLSNIDPGSGALYDQIQCVISRADFDELQRVALLTRLDQDEAVGPDVSCTIDTCSFAYGFNNVVFKVSFSDNVCWIARIQHAPVYASQASENAMDLLSEIATMRTVKARTTIPVPQVFSYDTSPCNPVGYPYILMEHLGGEILGDTIAAAVPSEHLPKLAKQLADVLFQLQGLAFDRLGRLWCGDDGRGSPEIIPLDLTDSSWPNPPESSLEWFYAQREDNNRLALETHYDDPEWRAACSVLMAAIPFIVVKDRLEGPFPLCHLDLHFGNLLFDDDYNLTGVIDWSHAQTVPIERLAVSPEFITFPAGSDEVNNSVLRLRSLVKESLQHLEKTQCSDEDSGENLDDSPPGDTSPTLLSHIFGTERADITHRCTYSFPRRALWDGRLVARLIFGEKVTWDLVVLMYGGININKA